MIMPVRRSTRKVEEKIEPKTSRGKKAGSTSSEMAKKRSVKDDVESVPAKKTKMVSSKPKRGGKKETEEPDKEAKTSSKVKEAESKKKTVKTESNKDVPEKPVSGPYDDLASTIKDPGWQKLLEPALKSQEFQQIISFLNKEHQAKKKIFPPKDQIFSTLNLTPLDNVKVVILGQDPYHDGSAHGLAFSILPGQEKLPSSLKTLYKELEEDPNVEFARPTHGCLEKWGERGVLMLNAVLTVEAHKANSHKSCGWSKFTDEVIQLLTGYKNDLVFVLWGNFAQKKQKHFNGKQIIIEGAHPSGLICGKFYGCRHFSRVDEELKKLKKKPVDWRLD